MKFREAEAEEDRLELTPLIDCVFLLLIFFLVTTSFYKLERELQVNLPQSSEGAEKSEETPSEIIINVMRDGVLYVNRKKMTVDELRETLKKTLKDFPNIPVVIRGDALAYHKQIVAVMTICKETNVGSLSISVIPSKGGS